MPVERIEVGARLFMCETWDNATPTVEEFEVVSVAKVWATMRAVRTNGHRDTLRLQLTDLTRSTSRWHITERAAILDCVARLERLINAERRSIERAEEAIVAAREMLAPSPVPEGAPETNPNGSNGE